MNNIKEMLQVGKVVEKLQKTDSPADPEYVIEAIRMKLASQKDGEYHIVLTQCISEKVLDICEPIYDVFEKDVAKLLLYKSRNEQILLLTEMLMIMY